MTIFSQLQISLKLVVKISVCKSLVISRTFFLPSDPGVKKQKFHYFFLDPDPETSKSRLRIRWRIILIHSPNNYFVLDVRNTEKIHFSYIENRRTFLYIDFFFITGKNISIYNNVWLFLIYINIFSRFEKKYFYIWNVLQFSIYKK